MLVEAGTQDVGGGTYTIMTQIAADALGVPSQRVTFRLGRYAVSRDASLGRIANRCDRGIRRLSAARALREKLSEWPFGPHRSTDAKSGLSWGWTDRLGKNARHCRLPERPALYRGTDRLQAGRRTPRNFRMYSFGAQFAEVRVDADLGQIQVSRMAGAFGAGKILNAKTARSQFMGGMVWGISLALHEHTAYDQRLGTHCEQ